MAKTQQKGQILYDKNGIGMTAAEWAKILNINPNSVRQRARLGKDVGASKNTANSKYQCPVTKVTRSINEWAAWLEIDATSFKNRIRDWGKNNPKTYARHPSRGNEPPNKYVHHAAEKKGQLFCKNPFTGESKLAWEWAEYYGVSLAEINSAINDFGRNSRALYRHLESRKV